MKFEKTETVFRIAGNLIVLFLIFVIYRNFCTIFDGLRDI